jgi:hypothetical protein
LGDAFVAFAACSALALGVVGLESNPTRAIPETMGTTPGRVPTAEHSYYDNQFLAALGGKATSVGPSIVVGMGHRTCSAFAEGASSARIRRVLVQKGLDEAEASRVVLAAVSTYCRDYADRAMG